MTCALWDEVRVGAGRPRAGAPPAHPLADEDAADLAAADPDALGLGGLRQRVQGPLRRRLGVLRRQEPLAALVQAAGWLGAGQGDDAATVGLGQAPRSAGSWPVAEPIDALGVEPVQPLPHRLRVAAQLLGDLGGAQTIPAVGDHPGAGDPVAGCVPGAGQLADGACPTRALRPARLAPSTASPPDSARAAASPLSDARSQPGCPLGSAGRTGALVGWSTRTSPPRTI